MKSCVCLYENKKNAGSLMAVVRTIMNHSSNEYDYRFETELYDDVNLLANEYAFSFSNFANMIYSFPAYTIFHHRKNGMRAVFVDQWHTDPENLSEEWRMIAVASPCLSDVRANEEFHVVVAVTSPTLSRDAYFFIFGEYPAERAS